MFRNLFGKRATAPKGTSKLSSSISSAILSVVGSGSIPPMPGAAQKAFKLSTDPNADARDFVEVIESDEALSARVLKIANSVYYDRGKKSTTIEQSVVTIGMQELRSLLSATTLSEIFPSRSPTRSHFWANDIATALIARTIGPRFGFKAEELFLGGLMHDVGKLLLIQRAPEQYAKVLKQIEAGGISWCAAEEAVFPFNHCEVGQLIAERWNFSEDLIAIIRNHHQSLDAQGGVSAALVIGCADTVSHALGIGHSSGMSAFRAQAQTLLTQVWELLAIGEGERKGFLDQCRRVVETEFDLYAGKHS